MDSLRASAGLLEHIARLGRRLEHRLQVLALLDELWLPRVDLVVLWLQEACVPRELVIDEFFDL